LGVQNSGIQQSDIHSDFSAGDIDRVFSVSRSVSEWYTPDCLADILLMGRAYLCILDDFFNCRQLFFGKENQQMPK
jgi:hypothetical protein